MEISALQGKNLTELCRCCLTTSNCLMKLAPEDEEAANDMISSILNFEVEIDENSPQSICERCVRLLDTSYEFQQLLKKSIKLIQSVVLHEHDKEDESTLMDLEETERVQANPIEFVDPEDSDYFDESPSISPEACMRLSEVNQNPVQEAIEEFNNKACVQCDFVTSNGGALLMHMKLRHKELRLRWCSTCNTLVDNLIEHTVKNHESDQLACEFCKKSFPTRSSLMTHRKWHTSEKPHKCHLCEKSFISINYLRTHLVKIHSEITQERDKEDESTLTESAEAESTQTDSIEVIDKTKKSHRMLTKIDHSLVEEAIKKTHEEFTNNRACVQCDFVAIKERALRMHMKLAHKELYERWCSTCYTVVDDLTEHTVKNHQSKPLTCQFCQRSFPSRHQLRNHLICHSSERPYNCHLCEKGGEKGFIARNHLRSHLLKVHGEIAHERNKEDASTLMESAEAESTQTDSIEVIDKTKKLTKIDHSLVEEAIKKTHEVFTNNTVCVQCDFVCGNGRVLGMHMKFRHKELYERWCSTCNTLVDDLIEHTVKNHQSNPLACQFCQKSFLSKCKLRSHLICHSNEKPYKCHLCESNFIQGTKLKIHLFRIHGDKSFEENMCHKCENCNIVYYNAQALEEHIKSHVVDENTPLVARNFCTRCQKEVSDPSVHYQEYHQRVPKKLQHSCTVCGKTFKRAHTLKLHMRGHAGNFPYSCKFCPKKATTRQQMRLHEQTHTGEKPHKCTFCDATFIQKSGLQTHMMMHTGKPFKCDVCKKAYVRPSMLRAHMRLHSGEKSVERPYLCSICGNRFKQRQHLELHLRVHTKDRRFTCEYCGHTFTQKASLKNHINIHLNREPYKCDQCPFSTRQSYGLTLHKRRRHLKKEESNTETL